MREWRPEGSRDLLDHRLFTVRLERLAAGDDRREALVLSAPEWVNIVPLLPDGRVLLVRQWRYGIAAPTLEIPGGMVDEGDPRQAAERELLEETGHRAASWSRLGVLHPNPAFLDNRLTIFLATGLTRVGDPQGDGDEEIELEAVELDAIPDLIAGGRITHALVVAAFHLLDLSRRG